MNGSPALEDFPRRSFASFMHFLWASFCALFNFMILCTRCRFGVMAIQDIWEHNIIFHLDWNLAREMFSWILCIRCEYIIGTNYTSRPDCLISQQVLVFPIRSGEWRSTWYPKFTSKVLSRKSALLVSLFEIHWHYFVMEADKLMRQ